MAGMDIWIELAAMLTMRLSKYIGWFVKYVDWDDCSRAKNSCLGNNITDVFMKYLKDDKWLPMFVVGTDNFNPTGVHVNLSQINLILQDNATGDSRVGTALELLRDVGVHFANRGLAPDATLAPGDEDVKCFFKVQVAIVPCNKGQTVDTAIFATNYQAREVPRNAMLLCGPQGVSFNLDDPNYGGLARYCPTEYDPVEGWKEFSNRTNVSKRTIKQCGTETKEQAIKALEKGFSVEVPMGPKGCKKSGSIMTIQVPIDQKKLREERAASERTREAAPAPKKQKPTPPGSPEVKQEPAFSELVALSPDDHSRPPLRSLDTTFETDYPKYTSLSANDDFLLGGPAFRSLGESEDAPETRLGMDDVGDALPDVGVTDHCRMGRYYRGPYLGPHAPLYGTDIHPDPAGGVVTVVKTLIVTCPVGPDGKILLTEDDVEELVKLAMDDLKCAVNCGGEANSLFSKMSEKLGQVTHTITPEAVHGIIKTMTGSLPAGIF